MNVIIPLKNDTRFNHGFKLHKTIMTVCYILTFFSFLALFSSSERSLEAYLWLILPLTASIGMKVIMLRLYEDAD